MTAPQLSVDTVNESISIANISQKFNGVNSIISKQRDSVIKNKANNMLSGIGVQPSEREDIINLANSSLSQYKQNVKFLTYTYSLWS